MYFVKGARELFFCLNRLDEKSRAPFILGNFIKKHSQTFIGVQFLENVFHWKEINRKGISKFHHIIL